jgi:surface antigen/Ni/Co efflux regulator RcnB
MKRVLIAIAAFGVLIAPLASAGPAPGKGNNKSSDRGGPPPGLANKPYGLPPGQAKKLWRQGERLPVDYIGPRYYIVEPRLYRLAPPPNGHRWIFVDGNAYLVLVASGLIADVVIGAVADPGYSPGPAVYADVDRTDRWRRRYTRTYTYGDDSYYRECRQSVDPAGVIAGALIGGLVGNAIGRGDGRTGATVAGVVLGGALGAALTRNLDCADRSYAYRTYYDGFNAGRPNSVYRWRNPDNGHYGDFRVGTYYNDADGFRCANYTQQIFIDGRPQAASGRACQQPDGTWTIVG